MTKVAVRSVVAMSAMALALAACSRSEPEETVVANDAGTVVTELPEAEAVEPAPLPSPPAAEVNAVEALPEAEPEAPDEQMLDDASATGMTARSRREAAEESAPGNARE